MNGQSISGACDRISREMSRLQDEIAPARRRMENLADLLQWIVMARASTSRHMVDILRPLAAEFGLALDFTPGERFPDGSYGWVTVRTAEPAGRAAP